MAIFSAFFQNAGQKRIRLRTYYFLLAFCIVIPIALCCGLALNLLRSAQSASAIGRVEESARLTALMIDSDIDRAQAVLKTLAHSHALAQNNLAEFYHEASQANAGSGAWIILYDRDGHQLVNTRVPYGAILATRADPQSVTRMIASGKGQVSGLKWGVALNDNFVIVEAPIRSASGAVYVIGQAFSPEFFAHSFAGRALPVSWRTAILDENGIIIARSSQAQAFVGKPARPETIAMITRAHSGALQHLTRRGVEVYDAFTHASRARWTVMVGAPVSDIHASMWRGVTIIGAGLLIAMLAALTLTVLTGRHLVRYVGRASESAALLGAGSEAKPLPRSAIVELEGLNEAIRDASARLQAEMGSRSAAEQERNALLILEQAARLKAEEQNAAKDEFLAMLGHELRNPLSAVASAVAILDGPMTPTDGMARRAREVLRRQTDHLRKLVDDLLEVNRALMGKITLHKAPVDLADVVQRCIDTLQAGGRTTGFDIKLTAHSAPVSADPTRLMQVVDNILDNAIKFSPAGGVIAVRVASEGDTAILTVRDGGLGIAPELIPTVFDVFVQGKQSLQRAHGGLGIGLSLVRRLVNLHGGEVGIASAGSGHGTTVTVRLPLRRDRNPELRVVSPVLPATERRRRVLLIEDNADAREMMSMLLELRSCEVFAAEDGASGLALASQQNPELAFIDIGLPGMDGYAVARALRGNPATSHIELVALTGYGTENDRQLAFGAGFTHHFTKPIKLADLDAALA